MNNFLKFTAIFTSLLLTSCVNQNTRITENLMPTTNACTKLNLLKSAYYDGFEQLKENNIQSRASNIWRAKYQLFGEHCQVFSWGGKQSNYSCSIVAPDEQTAKQYYVNANKITQQCLGDSWLKEESKRKNNEGMKTSFVNNESEEGNKVTFSTHLVPTSGLFSTKWSIYYYVGNNTQPTK